MLELKKSIYSSAGSSILFVEMYIELFETKVGFMLEVTLSRILFNIYINDIPILLKNPHFGEN